MSKSDIIQKTIAVCLFLTGVIHLLPLPGVLGSARLASLYGLAFEQADLLILMRHRAVLFGMLGLFLIYASFTTAVQLVALIGGAVSVVSFIVIASLVGGYNSAIARVVVADVVALVLLAIAAALYFLRARQSAS